MVQRGAGVACGRESGCTAAIEGAASSGPAVVPIADRLSMRLASVYLAYASLGLVLYPYLFYPIVLRALARPRPKDVRARSERLPSVTLVVSAHDEHQVIGRKLDNAVALDYPIDLLAIIVVSDASRDGTDEIVLDRACRDRRIRLLRMSERAGKTVGLNKALTTATSDVVVFSDANALYDPQAIRELVEPFRDESIGYTVGAAHYVDDLDTHAARSEGIYWRFELWLKRMESRAGSVIGGDGAIYAIRRCLYRELDRDAINDFVNPLQIVAAGYRGTFVPEARCFEQAASDFDREFARKRRIVNRSWRGFWNTLPSFRFRRDARFLFMLVSHKLVRWLALPLMLLSLTSAIVASTLGAVATALPLGLLLAGSLSAAVLAHYCARNDVEVPRPIYLNYYFYLAGLASVLGIWDDVRGVRHVTWTHVRGRF